MGGKNIAVSLVVIVMLNMPVEKIRLFIIFPKIQPEKAMHCKDKKG